MPWCEDCAKFWTPSSMKADGSCPTCGRVLTVGTTPPDAAETSAPSSPVGRSLSIHDVRQMANPDSENTKAPWHFKLMVGALAVYLGYRAWQLVAHFV